MTTKKIQISEDLKAVLTEIQNDSLVAQLLLKHEHEVDTLVDNPVDYISISREDRTKISYLTKERAALINPAELWTSSRRFQAKPGAFIGKLFKTMAPKEVEKFSNLFICQVRKPKFTFQVVSGDTIKDYYHFESYASESGSLGASCMKHDSCQQYLRVYTKNPNQVKLLVMLSETGNLLGRALLWTFDSYKIMDRIYTISDEELSYYFKQWANKNAYLYKQDQNWFNTCGFESDGKRQKLKLELTLDHWDFEFYPYMDTFKFIDFRTGKLYNYQYNSPYLKTLCSSEGSAYDRDYLRWDAIDDCCRYSGDAVWVSYKKIYTHPKNCEWSDINDTYILRGDFIWDSTIEDYIFSEDMSDYNDKTLIQQRRDAISKQRNDVKTTNDIISRLRSGELSFDDLA